MATYTPKKIPREDRARIAELERRLRALEHKMLQLPYSDDMVREANEISIKIFTLKKLHCE